jgi:hypothetical protein
MGRIGSRTLSGDLVILLLRNLQADAGSRINLHGGHQA